MRGIKYNNQRISTHLAKSWINSNANYVIIVKEISVTFIMLRDFNNSVLIYLKKYSELTLKYKAVQKLVNRNEIHLYPNPCIQTLGSYM